MGKTPHPRRTGQGAGIALKQARQEHPCYGVQSMPGTLPEDQKVSYGKGYRICREYGLLTKRRNPRGITKADPAAQSSDDLVRRDFASDAPNKKWLTDITEKGYVAHSDRGSPFTSHLYRATLEAKGFRQSMGRTGTCADNARMESFFATLKKAFITFSLFNCFCDNDILPSFIIEFYLKKGHFLK